MVDNSILVYTFVCVCACRVRFLKLTRKANVISTAFTQAIKAI